MQAEPQKKHQICTRCICDTTISTIRFDSEGVCQFCRSHDVLEAMYDLNNPQTKANLENLIEQIKHDGKGKAYDCVVGVSGGTDSSYVLYLAKKYGLRPIAVHFDNGWNTTQSVTNIKQMIEKLNVDLFTHVVDWEEFKDLQIAFLKASVPCIEAPTDVAIHGTLYRTAAQEGVKYILGGQCFRAEGTVPKEWSYLDGTYIQTIHKKFGSVKFKTFTNLSLFSVFYYTFIKGIKQIPILNYVEYSKPMAKQILKQEFGWSDYGGHHYENHYSKFAFGWWQFRKFNIDKRKISLSGPVRSKVLSREEALKQISTPPPVDDETVDYCINKLGITKDQFWTYFNTPAKSYKDYFTSENILKYMKYPVKLAVKMKYFTPVLYEKYFES